MHLFTLIYCERYEIQKSDQDLIIGSQQINMALEIRLLDNAHIKDKLPILSSVGSNLFNKIVLSISEDIYPLVIILTSYYKITFNYSEF